MPPPYRAFCVSLLSLLLYACGTREPGPVVVWESNRSGSWRIWAADPDGGNARQISPDEPEGEHMGPVISPDGRHVAYRVTADPLEAGPLFVVSLTTGKVRQLVDKAHATGRGNRVAVWRDEHSLFYLDGAKRTRLVDLRGGPVTEPLIQDKRELLPNPGFTAAFDHFSYYTLTPEGRITDPVHTFGGCEAYVTEDNRWGYRMMGAGGNLMAVDLQSGRTHQMLAIDDPRLPPERNYLYFPKISADQRYLTFSASPDQHDHYKSDYDVFIMEINPETLQVTGEPVRIAPHPQGDKYPDVWMGPPGLPAVPSRALPSGQVAAAQASAYPDTEERALFSWSGHDQPARAWTGEGNLQVIQPTAQGMVERRLGGALHFSGGSWTFPHLGTVFSRAIRHAGEFTLEAVIEVHNRQQTGPARLVSLSAGISQRNLTLGQEGTNLVLRVRTPETGDNGTNPQLVLIPLPEEAFHLTVVADASGVTTYVDGQEVSRQLSVKADFDSWDPMTFILGNETSQDRPWHGTLRGVALYARAFDADRIRSLAEAARVGMEEAPKVPIAGVKAEVLAVSPAWTQAALEPYESGLSSVRVRVLESDGPQLTPGDVIAIMHWSLLNRMPVPLPVKGDRLNLSLQPFSAFTFLKDKPILDEAEELTDIRWMSLSQ